VTSVCISLVWAVELQVLSMSVPLVVLWPNISWTGFDFLPRGINDGSTDTSLDAMDALVSDFVFLLSKVESQMSLMPVPHAVLLLNTSWLGFDSESR